MKNKNITVNNTKGYSTDGSYYKRQIRIPREILDNFIKELRQDVESIEQKAMISTPEWTIKTYGNKLLKQYENNNKILYPSLTIANMLAVYMHQNNLYKNTDRLWNAVNNYNTAIYIID